MWYEYINSFRKCIWNYHFKTNHGYFRNWLCFSLEVNKIKNYQPSICLKQDLLHCEIQCVQNQCWRMWSLNCNDNPGDPHNTRNDFISLFHNNVFALILANDFEIYSFHRQYSGWRWKRAKQFLCSNRNVDASINGGFIIWLRSYGLTIFDRVHSNSWIKYEIKTWIDNNNKMNQRGLSYSL